MKPPKRTYNYDAFFDASVYDTGQGECDFVRKTKEDITQTLCARWKRKNRIKQLKRTIARLTAENARLLQKWKQS